MEVTFIPTRLFLIASITSVLHMITLKSNIWANEIPLQKPVCIVSFIDEKGTEWYSASEATFGDEHAVNFVLFGINATTIDELLVSLRQKRPNSFLILGSVHSLDFPGHSFRALSVPEAQEVKVKCQIVGLIRSRRP